MVSFTSGRAQFTPAFVTGFMESSFTAEFEVEAMYYYSIYDMSQLVVCFRPFPIGHRFGRVEILPDVLLIVQFSECVFVGRRHWQHYGGF